MTIIGSSSSGEICNEGYLDDSAVLMVLTDDENRFYSGGIENITSKMVMKNIMAKSKNKGFKHGIVVSCACRKLINIFNKSREAEIIKKHIHENINLIGFYSFGEISPIEDSEGNIYNFYNNETISICLF